MAIAGVAYAISASAATITAMGIGYYALGFALNMIIASVISKALFSPSQPSFDSTAGSSPNLGNRQQIAPATDNKLAVVYGTAFVGGTIIDLSISNDNQDLYFVCPASVPVTSDNAIT